jgi:hypothetical protein
MNLSTGRFAHHHDEQKKHPRTSQYSNYYRCVDDYFETVIQISDGTPLGNNQKTAEL